MLIEEFEQHFNIYTIELIHHLVRTEQCKNSVLNLISASTGVTKEEALKFYIKYKEKLCSKT